jgi:hypothetical protein
LAREAGKDGLAVGAVLLSLRLVATDDVAAAFASDLFDEQLGLARLALDQQRNERVVVLPHEAAGDRIRSLASAEDVFELALFEPLDRRGRDPAAIGDDANPADGKPCAQAVDHRQQRRDISSVSLAHLSADRPAVAVDDEAEDHLFQVRPVVLGIAALPQRFAALTVK